MFDWVLNTPLYFSCKFSLSYSIVYENIIWKDFFNLREPTLSMQKREPEGFRNFSKKNSQHRGPQSLIFHGSSILSKNISWHLPSILVSCLRLACGSIQDSIHSNIQIIKGVNIRNNIQKLIFKEIHQKISNDFFPYQNSFTDIK